MYVVEHNKFKSVDIPWQPLYFNFSFVLFYFLYFLGLFTWNEETPANIDKAKQFQM